MAVHAGATPRCDFVSVVGGVVIGAGQMTLGTHAVAFRHQLVAVRVMAVGTGHPGLMHLALDKRSVDIDLVTDLTIGPVKRLFNHREAVSIQ